MGGKKEATLATRGEGKKGKRMGKYVGVVGTDNKCKEREKTLEERSLLQVLGERGLLPENQSPTKKKDEGGKK